MPSGSAKIVAELFAMVVLRRFLAFFTVAGDVKLRRGLRQANQSFHIF
jgi:hypothetical protein